MGIYDEFRASIGRDGLDVGYLDALDDMKRAELVRELRRASDHYDVLALGRVGYPSDESLVRACLQTASLEVRSAAARALWDLAGSVEGLPAIRSVAISERASPVQKTRVLGLLHGIASPAAFEILEASLHDSSFLVRRAAGVLLAEASGRRAGKQSLERSLLNYDVEHSNAFAERLRKLRERR